jgi:hypothetical protein
VEEHPSGWIFARGGDAWIACRPLQPYFWKPIEGGGRRLFSPYLKNGFVVQAAPVSEYPSLAAFQKAILALPLRLRTDPVPAVAFRSLRGRNLEFAYDAEPAIDGRPRDLAAWPLFGGPFLNAPVDSRMLKLSHGGVERVLDFRTLTITERPQEQPR